VALGSALLAAFIADVLARRSGVPDVVVLILLGLLLGPGLHLASESTLISLAPYVGLMALALILFDAGMDIRPRELGGISGRAAAFAAVSVLVSFLALFPFAYYEIVGRSVPLALIFAGALSCTSSAVVVPIAARLTLPPGARSTINLSSALEDTFAIITVTTLLLFYTPGHAGISLVVSTILPLPGGILGGFLGGLLWIVVSARYQRLKFFSMATVGFLLFLAGLVDLLGGSGILAALVFGIVLGNASSFERFFHWGRTMDLLPYVRQFQTEAAFALRAYFLLLLGMLVVIGANFLNVVVLGAALAGVLILLRYLVVSTFVERSLFPSRWRAPLSALGTRGLTSAVLVVLPVSSGLISSAGIFLDPTLIVILCFTVYTTFAVYFYREGTGPAPARSPPPPPVGSPEEGPAWESMWSTLLGENPLPEAGPSPGTAGGAVEPPAGPPSEPAPTPPREPPPLPRRRDR
jgi:NhaP-type Na+/H+ or K+/H+ antiporter